MTRTTTKGPVEDDTVAATTRSRSAIIAAYVEDSDSLQRQKEGDNELPVDSAADGKEEEEEGLVTTAAMTVVQPSKAPPPPSHSYEDFQCAKKKSTTTKDVEPVKFRSVQQTTKQQQATAIREATIAAYIEDSDDEDSDDNDGVDEVLSSVTPFPSNNESAGVGQQQHQAVVVQPGAFLGAPGEALQPAPAFIKSQLRGHNNNHYRSHQEGPSLALQDEPSLDPPPCRNSSTPSLVQAFRVSSKNFSSKQFWGSAAVEVDPRELENQSTRDKEEEKRWFCFCALAGLGIAIFVICVTIGIRQSKKQRQQQTRGSRHPAAGELLPPSTQVPSPKETPTPLMDNLPDFTLKSLKDPFSPQSEAYNWLGKHPDLNNMEQWRRRQLLALGSFYFAFDGPNWPLNIGKDWLDPTKHECHWFSMAFGEFTSTEDVNNHFVQSTSTGGTSGGGDSTTTTICNKEGEYTVLRIATAADIGFGIGNVAIPPELSFLTALTHFSIRRNGIVNVSTAPSLLPLDFYQLSNLRHLWLSKNSWNTPLPSELGLLTKLESIQFNRADFYGPLPSQLGALTRLKFLKLDNNRLTGSIPKEWGKMTSIQRIQLQVNRLSGTVPNGLSSALKTFSIYNNPMLSGTLPNHLCSIDTNSSCTVVDLRGKTRSCNLSYNCTSRFCGCDCSCATTTNNNGVNDTST